MKKENHHSKLKFQQGQRKTDGKERTMEHNERIKIRREYKCTEYTFLSFFSIIMWKKSNLKLAIRYFIYLHVAHIQTGVKRGEVRLNNLKSLGVY